MACRWHRVCCFAGAAPLSCQCCMCKTHVGLLPVVLSRCDILKYARQPDVSACSLWSRSVRLLTVRIKTEGCGMSELSRGGRLGAPRCRKRSWLPWLLVQETRAAVGRAVRSLGCVLVREDRWPASGGRTLKPAMSSGELIAELVVAPHGGSGWADDLVGAQPP